MRKAFEKNDKAFMQEDAKSVLEPLVSNYVADEKIYLFIIISKSGI